MKILKDSAAWIGGAVIISAAAGAMYSPVRAGEADVVGVVFAESAPGVYRFDVTVRHADSGWEHYADGWELRDGDGAVVANRVLLHPHVGEQPFTRSLAGVRLPDGLHRVIIRAHDNVHGYGGVEMTVDLPE